MRYFVTGATGFIGRHLVQELLRNRDGEIQVLVREGSKERLQGLIEGLEGGERVTPVVGDLTQEHLGIAQAWIDEQRGTIDHFFHLAAVYDMTADSDTNDLANVTGTRNAVALANALQAGILHHVSSVAVSGLHKGLFREDMFDEGQKLPSSYHQTKFDSELIAREEATVPWRIYRPAVVIGHSQTGEMDKIDGPYYFFKAIQKVRHALPEWFPLIGLELGFTNVVPVDYVAGAMDHIAHQDGLDGQAFHLCASKSQRSGEVLNTFARAAHAPQMAIRIDKRLTDALPKGVGSLLLALPALKGVRGTVLADLGIPEEVIGHVAFTAQFDTRDTERALADSTIAVPPLGDYAELIWDYWERTLDPDLYKDRSFGAAINGRTVVITGASSGIGRAAALKIAAAGGIPLLVARSIDKLGEAKAEIEASGGTAYIYSADLSDLEAIDDVAKQILSDHARVDVLVNNAGRSIRRS
ncbi:MAG: SDR family oxidoreductase, partial [Solirubrobacteraceae bacterium]